MIATWDLSRLGFFLFYTLITLSAVNLAVYTAREGRMGYSLVFQVYACLTFTMMLGYAGVFK